MPAFEELGRAGVGEGLFSERLAFFHLTFDFVLFDFGTIRRQKTAGSLVLYIP